ncbi:MAG: AAA family ATPase [Fluviibacter phosphoraccumulans]
MKLRRIAKINQYRIFKGFAWPKTLEDFERYNLIYGWNGTGKTTLSGLLKYLQTQTAVPVGDIEFVLDDTSFTGNEIAEVKLPQVRVFNRDTVAQSVFESSGGALEQLPPVYIFGEDSAEKQRNLDTLKAALPAFAEAVKTNSREEIKTKKELDDYAITTARSIKNLLVAPGGGFNNYNAADFRVQMKNLESSSAPQLTGEERQSLLELKDAKPLPALELATLEFPDIAKLLQEVQSTLQVTVVSAVIDELIENPAVANWIQSGLSLHGNGPDTESCKFCNQPLPKARLERLEAHFNDQFRQFRQDLEALAVRIEESANAIDIDSLPGKNELYPEIRIEYDKARCLVDHHFNNIRCALLSLSKIVRTKQESVFKRLEIKDFLIYDRGLSEEGIKSLSTLIEAVTSGVQKLDELMGKDALERAMAILVQHNSKTTSFAEQVGSARERLHFHELSVALPGWTDRQAQYDVAEKNHKAAKESLIKAQQDLSILETDIRNHRQPANELNSELASYLGHDEIQVEVENTGYRIIRRDGAATNLSEGERTAIAFLYFLKSLQDHSFDLTQGIVVVDDPISSLDTNAIYSAFGFMKRRLTDAGQLFVLTHNYSFFRQVKNWYQHLNKRAKRNSKPAKFYMLKALYKDGSRSSAIVALDPFLRDYESEYHFLFKRVLEASMLSSDTSLQTYYELPNLARRLLEAFLVFKVPDEKTLYARLEAVDFDPPKKTRILRFLDTNSHAEQISEGFDDASALAEAPEVLRDLLELIEKHDNQHFSRMKLAIAPQD